jgi:menaquinone C8-methyltransferase
MPWFEPPLLAVLKHEYRASMRFGAAQALPAPSAVARPLQLYVHVPFCESLCPFCSFHRVQFREQKAAPYFEALRAEIRAYHARGFSFTDVYVGGGTPTIAPQELGATLALIRSLWPVRTVSVETNPNHLREPLLAQLAAAGVDRLSVGVQSFDDELLRQMQRYGPYGSGAQIRERLAATRGRFPTLNVDMIFNLPNQTHAMLERDLATLLELEVDQVSFYPLMTASSARQRMDKTLGRVDPGRRHEFYQGILAALRPRYRASSAWCFTRAGQAADARLIDEYIVDHDEFVGVGSGAFSYLDGRLYATTFSLNQYRRLIDAGASAITQSKRLTLKERMRYHFLVRLFGLSLPYADIRRAYGGAFWWRMAPELAAMRLLGALRFTASGIELTDTGMYCWMLMMAEFFNAVNEFRDQARLHIRAELEELPRASAPKGSVTARAP